MRQLMAGVAVAAAVLTVTGCSADRPGQASPAKAAMPAVSASAVAGVPASPGDPVVTAQVCTAATAAAAAGTQMFNDQITALEQAASAGDQTAMIAAATAIQDQLQELVASLDTWAAKSISPALRVVLTEAAKSVAEISTASYTGTPQDIQRQLLDLVASFTKACSG